MDRVLAMETYVRVVQGGSFSKAAQHMDISSGLITRRIAQLESMLGTRLITRTTRRLHVTTSGQDYYHFCVRILEDIRRGEAAVAQGHEQASGDIRVLAPKSFGSLYVSDAVAEFMPQFPDIIVSLSLSDISPESFNLVEKGFDFAIRLASMADSTFVTRKIGTVRWIVCAAPSYLRLHGEPNVPRDLAHHQCLLNTKTNADGVWHFLEGGGDVDIKSMIRMRSNSAIVLRRAALEGHGIALLPLYCIEADLAAGRLQPILSRYPQSDTFIYGVFPHGQLIPRRVRIFADFMIERLRVAEKRYEGSDASDSKSRGLRRRPALKKRVQPSNAHGVGERTR